MVRTARAGLPAARGAHYGRRVGATTPIDLRGLAAAMAGRLVTPADDGWDAARQAWNLTVDQHPAAVAEVADPTDVALVLRAAAGAGCRVAPQRTGHGAIVRGPLDDVVLMRTSGLGGVEVDPASARAVVGAGALWEEVAAAAAPHRLAALAGTSGGVGVAGYTLGGGVGWLARRHGIACNAVRALDVVTADGHALRVDDASEPDLFWALRGGGGGYAVVTGLEFGLVPATSVYAGMLLWPMERAEEVLATWGAWTDALPETVSSLGRLLRMPPLPSVPEALRGRAFVGVEAACLTRPAEAADLLAPLRALAPEIDTFAPLPPHALARLHMDPREPVSAIGDGMLLDDFPPEAARALVEAAGAASSSPLTSVEVRHLGAAVARPDPGHGALDRIDAPFAVFGAGAATTPEAGAAVTASLALVRADLTPWDSRRSTMNLADGATLAESLFPPDVLERLRAVKRRYDPDDVILANHPVSAHA